MNESKREQNINSILIYQMKIIKVGYGDVYCRTTLGKIIIILFLFFGIVSL
jgi:hypothetical protein